MQPEKALGHKDDFTPEELAGKVVDGLTGYVFATNEDYLAHTSPVTGYQPTDPKHFGVRFLRVQKAALKRGKSLTKARENGIDADIEVAKGADVDSKTMRALNEVKRLEITKKNAATRELKKTKKA